MQLRLQNTGFVRVYLHLLQKKKNTHTFWKLSFPHKHVTAGFWMEKKKSWHSSSSALPSYRKHNGNGSMPPLCWITIFTGFTREEVHGGTADGNIRTSFLQRPCDSHHSKPTLTFPANDTNWGLWIFHGCFTRTWTNNIFLDVTVSVTLGLLSKNVLCRITVFL